MSQENSPFSRYGLGDVYPYQPISTRAMGGVSTSFLDGQSINTTNPASYSYNRFVTYDFGLSVDSRSLKSTKPAGAYSSTNFTPSYLTLAVPINQLKGIGMAIGLRPVTRINYNVSQRGRLNGIDSFTTVYEGNGGLNQFFLGFGKRWHSFAVGVNGGFNFGRKEANTRTILLNDTVAYRSGLQGTTTSFKGLFLEGGLMYEAKLATAAGKIKGSKEIYFLRLGATGALKQTLHASMDSLAETFVYDANGGTQKLDSVKSVNNIKGNIIYPRKFSAGVMLQKAYSDERGSFDRWMLGADITMQNWSSDYRFFNRTDNVNNSFIFHIGGSYIPDATDTRRFWSRVTYRAGFYSGKDYINADTKGLKTYAGTFGFGFPIRKWRAYDYQFSLVNTSFEIGKRGTGVNNVTESFFKFSLGLSLSDIWFRKHKYD
ncbi:MAG: hypothetical protein JWN76_3703 [Chitinophagaceae bacterium]|nr:hypothetical protein [Chitinophagaceae bacterium]